MRKIKNILYMIMNVITALAAAISVLILESSNPIPFAIAVFFSTAWICSYCKVQDLYYKRYNNSYSHKHRHNISIKGDLR